VPAPERVEARAYTSLLVALAVEVAVFGVLAPSFLSVANAFEISRFSVELGLLAVAMTPVVITGGIDLSVGSMVYFYKGRPRRGYSPCEASWCGK